MWAQISQPSRTWQLMTNEPVIGEAPPACACEGVGGGGVVIIIIIIIIIRQRARRAVSYLIVDLSALCLVASRMKVAAAAWLCFSRTRSMCCSSGWSAHRGHGVRLDHLDTQQPAYGLGEMIVRYRCFFSPGDPYLGSPRLTCRMEINDDLHVNGPLSCSRRGVLFVCLHSGHFTF